MASGVVKIHCYILSARGPGGGQKYPHISYSIWQPLLLRLRQTQYKSDYGMKAT
jgi:hypothetical protein